MPSATLVWPSLDEHSYPLPTTFEYISSSEDADLSFNKRWQGPVENVQSLVPSGISYCLLMDSGMQQLHKCQTGSEAFEGHQEVTEITPRLIY